MLERSGPLTVLVTGAGRGIGAAAALAFAEAGGHRIALHYASSREAAEATAASCHAAGAETLVIQADLSRGEEVQRMKEQLTGLDWQPDILVNNAGIAYYGLLDEMPEEAWDRVLDTNLKSAYLCSKAFIPWMLSRRFGRIVNVSSIWGISGASSESAYSASKGGMNTLTRALAKELAPSRITVNAVAPGIVKTSMLDEFTSEETAALLAEIPLGRFAEPAEIAALVRFLSHTDSGYLTGQIISPNGGWLI